MVRSGNLHPIYIQGRLGGDTSQSAGSVEMVASTVERLVSQHLEVGSESNLAHLAAAGDLLARRTDNVRTLCTQGLQIGWGSTAGTRRVLGWRVSKSCRPTPSSLHRAVYSLMRRASALTNQPPTARSSASSTRRCMASTQDSPLRVRLTQHPAMHPTGETETLVPRSKGFVEAVRGVCRLAHPSGGFKHLQEIRPLVQTVSGGACGLTQARPRSATRRWRRCRAR